LLLWSVSHAYISCNKQVDESKQVFAVFISFVILLKLVAPDWKEVFYGLVPSRVSAPSVHVEQG